MDETYTAFTEALDKAYAELRNAQTAAKTAGDPFIEGLLAGAEANLDRAYDEAKLWLDDTNDGTDEDAEDTDTETDDEELDDA